ncbi:MAG: hypothetical protein ACE5OZ_24925 [Candidatus Heimdallarchaeota archaeon]
MSTEADDSSSRSRGESQERDRVLPGKNFKDVVLWALEKLTLIDQRLCSAGVFNLTKDSLQAQKIELLQLLMDHPQQVRQVWALQTKSDKQVWLDDLTEVLVWALRELTLVFHRLYSAGIFSWADDFLMDQEMALFQLLQQPPEQLRRELSIIQQQQESHSNSSLKEGMSKCPK